MSIVHQQYHNRKNQESGEKLLQVKHYFLKERFFSDRLEHAGHHIKRAEWDIRPAFD